MNNKLKDVNDAYELLKKLDAPPRLIRHAYLVGEAADLLIEKLDNIGIKLDANFVRLGVALHDVGKIIHLDELISKGNKHEADGESLLIANGVEPHLARCCRSHAQWQAMDCLLEELLIALADKLWKGKREVELEKEIIDRLSKLTSKDYWQLFIELDNHFETIASTGEERLVRSQM